MLHVGKTYISKKGERFFILARKTLPASNGCDFIGENTKTGVITHFKVNGKHGFSEDFDLMTDRYKWIGIDHKTLACPVFNRKEDISQTYDAYLRIENDNLDTVAFVTRAGFLNHYA